MRNLVIRKLSGINGRYEVFDGANYLGSFSDFDESLAKAGNFAKTIEEDVELKLVVKGKFE